MYSSKIDSVALIYPKCTVVPETGHGFLNVVCYD